MEFQTFTNFYDKIKKSQNLITSNTNINFTPAKQKNFFFINQEFFLKSKFFKLKKMNNILIPKYQYSNLVTWFIHNVYLVNWKKKKKFFFFLTKKANLYTSINKYKKINIYTQRGWSSKQKLILLKKKFKK